MNFDIINNSKVSDLKNEKPPTSNKRPGLPRCRSNQNLGRSHRQTVVDHRISQFQTQQAVNNLLNFENKLEKDLQVTTASLIKRMKDHALLRREEDHSDSAALLVPSFENKLIECLAKMKKEFIPANKNYYAMSLKLFF